MHPLSIRLRFACKLTLAILMALLLGFAFGLSTPRWSALTAALVAAGPAFAAGGEPFAGAIRYRGWLRIIGTLIGCLCALLLMMIFIRAPLLMLLLCCLWAGVCTWLSSLVRIENAYAWGLSGYTTLIIVISCLTEPQFILQLALERCGEIVLGIVCAVLADTLLAPRSVKGEVDRVVGGLLLNHWQLLQRCVANDDRAALDRHWHTLMREGQALEGMRASLALESLRWQATCRRLTHLHTLTLSLITRACEICLQRERQPLPSCFQALISVPLTTPAEAYQRLKRLRRLLAAYGGSRVSPALIAWIAAASQLQWLSKGVVSAVPIGQQEAALLRQGAPGRPLRTSVGRHALINGVRTWLATTLGTLFWLWSGWQAGSGCIIMIAVVTSLAVRTPNPRMAAIDFLLGGVAGVAYRRPVLPADLARHRAEPDAAMPEPRDADLSLWDGGAEAPSRFAGNPGVDAQHPGVKQPDAFSATELSRQRSRSGDRLCAGVAGLAAGTRSLACTYRADGTASPAVCRAGDAGCEGYSRQSVARVVSSVGDGINAVSRGYRPLSPRLDADRVAPKLAPGGATL